MAENKEATSGKSGEGGDQEQGRQNPGAKPKVLTDLLPKKIPHVLNDNYVPESPPDTGDDKGTRPDVAIPETQQCSGDSENPSSPVFGRTLTQFNREKIERHVVVDKMLQEEIDAHISKMHDDKSRKTPKEIKVRLSNRQQIRIEIDKIVQSSGRKVRILEQVDGEFVTFRCVRDLKRSKKRRKPVDTTPSENVKKKEYKHMDRLVSRYRRDIYYHKAESSGKALQQMAIASVRGLEKVYEIYIPTLATLTFNNKELYPVYGDQLHRRFQWPEHMSVTNVCKMLKRDTRKPVDLQVVKERMMIDEVSEGRKKYKHRISTFSVLTEAEAVKMAYDYKLILDEQDLPTATGEEMTIGDLSQTYIDHYEREIPFDRLTHGAGPALLSLTVYHFMDWIGAQGNLILDPAAPDRESTGFKEWGDRLAGVVEVEEDKSSTDYARKRKSRKGVASSEKGHGSDFGDDKSSVGDEDDMQDFQATTGRGQRKAATSARARILDTYDFTHEDDEEEGSDEDDCRLIDDPNSSKDMDSEERQLNLVKLEKTQKKIRHQMSKSANDMGRLKELQTKINTAIETVQEADKAEKASSHGNTSRDNSFEEGVSDSQLLRAESDAIEKDREIEALRLEAELMRARLDESDPYAYALTRKNLMDLRCKDLLSAFLKFRNKGEEFRPYLENAEAALDKVCQPTIGPGETMYQSAAGTLDKLKDFVQRGIITPNIVFNKKTFHKTGLDGTRKEKYIYVFQALEIKAEGNEDRLMAQDVMLMDYETGDGTTPPDFDEKLKKMKKEDEEAAKEVKDKDKEVAGKDKEKEGGDKKQNKKAADVVDKGLEEVENSEKDIEEKGADSSVSTDGGSVEENMELEEERPKFPQESSVLAEAMDTAEGNYRKGQRKHSSAARTRTSPGSRQQVSAAEVNLCTDEVGNRSVCMKPPHTTSSADFSVSDLREAGVVNAATKGKKIRKDVASVHATTRSTRSSVQK